MLFMLTLDKDVRETQTNFYVTLINSAKYPKCTVYIEG